MKSIYPWQSQQWQALSSQIQGKGLPHALLFHGVADIGKLQCAEVLAEVMLCASQTGDIACGFCKQCQLLNGGFHPDLLQLGPEGASQTIQVDAVRGLIEFLSKTSQQGGWKVAILKDAERMNTSAANALLKSLEEPAPNTLLILVSNDPSRLLATVKSRCRQMLFPLPDINDSLPWLGEVISSNDQAKPLLDAAHGRPLFALKLSQEGLLEARSELENRLSDLTQGVISTLECASFCDKQEAGLALDWFYYYVGSQIRSSVDGSRQRKLFRFLERLTESKILLNSPSNPNSLLVWEELMLDWKAYSS